MEEIMRFIKENYTLLIVGFIFLIFCSFLVYQGFIDVQIDKIVPSYGYVVSKDLTQDIFFETYNPRIEIGYDVVYEGKVYSRSRKFSVSTELYYNVSYGDLIFFDENNQPILEEKNEEY